MEKKATAVLKPKLSSWTLWLGFAAMITLAAGLVHLAERASLADASVKLSAVIVLPTATCTPTPTFTATFTQTVTATMTASPTATPVIAFQDHFIGTAGAQPTNWWDYTQNPAVQAEIAYSYTPSYAAITVTAGNNYGYVLSPNITCNVDTYPSVLVIVSGISPSTTWRLGIQEQASPWAFANLNTSSSDTGTFIFNYRDLMGWAGTGTHTFSLELTVEGLGGSYIEVDEVRVFY